MPSEYKYIVRILGTDLDGSKKILYALSKINGVGINLAQALVNALNLNHELKIGELSDDDISKIEKAIKEPTKYGIPPWLLNYRKDLETGTDMHLVSSDLVLKIRSNIDMMKEIRSWRGIRHALGLKVRGQKTRTTSRRGRAVGVKVKKIGR